MHIAYRTMAPTTKSLQSFRELRIGKKFPCKNIKYISRVVCRRTATMFNAIFIFMFLICCCFAKWFSCRSEAMRGNSLSANMFFNFFSNFYLWKNGERNNNRNHQQMHPQFIAHLSAKKYLCVHKSVASARIDSLKSIHWPMPSHSLFRF